MVRIVYQQGILIKKYGLRLLKRDTVLRSV